MSILGPMASTGFTKKFSFRACFTRSAKMFLVMKLELRENYGKSLKY